MCKKMTTRTRTALTLAAVAMAILSLTTTSANAGVISYVQITDDADSGISADNTYTHKLDFGTGSPGALINGVQFDAYNNAANGTLNFNREVFSGLLSDHAGNAGHNVSGSLADLMTDMYYNGNNAIDGTRTWTLSGLTAGQTYSTRIYTRQWGPDDNRLVTFVFDPDGAGPIADSTPKISQDNATSMGFTNGNDAYYINYQFTAVAGEDLVITLTQDIYNYSWHLYGLTNEIAGPVTKAYGPDPSSGTLHEDTWISLGWRAGDFAASHDVYIGDNFDAVNEGAEGTLIGNQTATFIVAGFPGFAYPDGLIPGTTYYWRIDEVNDTEPNSPWKGDVWSFMIPPKTAYAPDPADSGETVAVNASLKWTPGFGAKLHTLYFGDNFDDVSNAAGGLPQGAATYSPGELKQAKTYYWRVDEFDAITTYTGNVWSFTTEGAVAALNPANGALDVTQTPVLTWAPGFGASHEVYFGADEASLELKGSGNLGSESYDPGQLEWDTTYYWRVDEANGANADSPWTGPLWSFTTANFLIVDDFESYNDLDEGDPGSNRLYLAWLDGFDNPATNGSVVGNANAPFAEQTIVNSGLQSMPMSYDNAVGKSEATLTLTSNRDWTVNGVNALTILYRGSSSNAAEPMYVVLNGSAVITNDVPDAAQKGSWTEWNIDLQAFADQGVNLANVNSITLGLGNRSNPTAGGAGMMYFDDIRLYPPAP